MVCCLFATVIVGLLIIVYGLLFVCYGHCWFVVCLLLFMVIVCIVCLFVIVYGLLFVCYGHCLCSLIVC